jgi:hypothetical protein
MSSLRLSSASEREGKGYLKRHLVFDCKRDGKLATGLMGLGINGGSILSNPQTYVGFVGGASQVSSSVEGGLSSWSC